MGRAGVIDVRDGWKGNEALTIYLFGSRGGKYEFEKTVDFTPPASPANLFEDITEFYLSLPVSSLNFRMLSLPFSDSQKLKSIIPFELDGLILGGSESIVFDSVVMDQSADTHDVVVTYIERRSLREILAGLSLAGMDPQVVTSIELQAILGKADGDIASHLMSPGSLSPDERIDAAGKELISPTINLRTGPFAFTRDSEKMKKSLRVTEILAVLLALVINADLAFKIIAERKEVSGVKKEMRSLYTGLFPNDKKITDELYQLKSKMKELRERGETIAGVSPLQLMTDLAQRTVPGVKFDEMNLDREVVTVKGEAVSMESVDRVKTKLSEFLNDVTASDIKSSVEGKILFTVVAKVRPS